MKAGEGMDERTSLLKNQVMAKKNEEQFHQRHIFTINLVGLPGSGKTSVLQRTFAEMGDMKFYMMVGGQQTMMDANRVADMGIDTIQINPAKKSGINASMVNRALDELKPQENSILFIENTGPAAELSKYSLGENVRVVVLSVTEGDDKPLQFPELFKASTLCLINKIDLLPYVNFNTTRAKENACSNNPRLQFLNVSAVSGEGMDKWYRWLRAEVSFCFLNREAETI